MEDEGRRNSDSGLAHATVSTFEHLEEGMESLEVKYHLKDDASNLLSLFKHKPNVELNLVSLCLLPLRMIGKFFTHKVATNVDGTYSGKATHNAVTDTLERLEKQVGMLLVKDFKSAKTMFTAALKQWRAGNGERAKTQFEQAWNLSVQAYSTLNPMEKVVCTELRICAAAGCMTDEEYEVEAQDAIHALVHDESLIKELKDRSFAPAWITDGKQKNHRLLLRCYDMIDATLSASHCRWRSTLPAGWSTALQFEDGLFTEEVARKVGINDKKATFEGHSCSVKSVSFSPDGASIVSGSLDNTVKVWSVESGECVTTFKGHSLRVISVSFSTDGASIVSGSADNTVKVWSVESGECVTTFEGHSYPVMSVSFSPDGASIVSGSLDNTVKVWSVESGECVTTFEGHSVDVTSVSFSPDGASIVSGSRDNTCGER
eukprot:Stramenopile-MAST_4_protein_5075